MSSTKNKFVSNLTEADLLDIYRLLLLTRRFEETLIRLYHSGRIRGHPHSSIGQEAIGVGATFGLRQDDLICPSLRSLGAYLAKGVPPRLIMAEAFRKETGPSGGKWVYHHLGEPTHGVILTSAVVGGSIPVAVGAALAAKIKEMPQTVVTFFGDGATSRGDFHEAVNLAAVLDLPVVFVCENNLYAISTPQHRQMKIHNIADRAAGYGIPGVIVDGCNVLSVYGEVQRAVERARGGEGPTLLECKTYRWRGHSEIDSPDEGRPEEELSEWRERCPIRTLGSYLRQRGLLDDGRAEQIENEIERELEEAIRFSEASPEPSPETALGDVYA